MTIAEWSIKNNRTALALFLIIIIGGLWTYFTIPQKENPSFTIRQALVLTKFPGASPKRVEELVTDTLEDSLRDIPEIKNILSQSMTGVSVITVELYEKYDNIDKIWEDLRNKVADTKPSLPESAHDPVINDEYGDVFGICVAITGKDFTFRELKDAAEFTRNKLLHIKNIGKVEIWGEQKERIYVDFSNAGLAEYGFTPFMVAQAIQQQNTIQPSGRVKVGPERIILEPTGEFNSLEELKNMSLRPPGFKHAIALKDIADITRYYEDPPGTLVRYNGEPTVLLAISMADQGNILTLGKNVINALGEQQKLLPLGLDYNVLVYQPKFVGQAVDNFMINLLEAVIFVIIVMLLFAGWRTGLIAGALIPTAILACILLLPTFDIALQKISIASLIISLGILVDNGVVVSENILVRVTNGESRLDAVRKAVRFLRIPLLAASLTTIFAFLPIPLAQSVTGEFTFSLFVVVSVTLAASWVLAMTLIPMLSYYFTKPNEQKQTFTGTLHTLYRRLLLFALRNRALFLGIILLACGIAAWGFQYVPKMFFPPNERSQFTIDFRQPYGTDIRTTRDRVARLESFLLEQEETESVGTFVGSGGPRWYLSLNLEQDKPNYAMVLVNTHTVKDLNTLMPKTRKQLQSQFPDTRFSIKQLTNGPPVGAPIQVRISGPQVDTIYELRAEIADILENTQGITTVWDDWGEQTKKLVVDIKQNKAKRIGLTANDIALSLQMQMSGMPVSNFREQDKSIPIILRSKQDYREDIGKIEGLNVYTYSDQRSAPLLQVARTKLQWQPSNIRRRNQIRTMTVKADILGRYASDVQSEISGKITKLVQSPDWPQRYSIEYGGEQSESSEANRSILINIPLALGLIILVLTAQFNSFKRPVIIFLTVPLMICGITPGLLLTGSPFGFMALLGFISLVGIVVNNAIMIIDQIDILRKDENFSDPEAVILAGLKRSRPIVMTAATTIMGMIPLSLQGGEMWRPMANCIISGLAVSSILTLVVCPVLFSLLFRISFQEYTYDPDLPLRPVQEYE